jgi:hypothetical protein
LPLAGSGITLLVLLSTDQAERVLGATLTPSELSFYTLVPDVKPRNYSGLGLFEYLVWIELMEMQPIMAIWSGFALGGEIVANSTEALAPYVEQARQQVRSFIHLKTKRCLIWTKRLNSLLEIPARQVVHSAHH